MILLLTQAISSPNLWLWLAATTIAIVLLASAAGQRRTSLIETLRAFVRGPEPEMPEPEPDADAADGNDSEASK